MCTMLSQQGIRGFSNPSICTSHNADLQPFVDLLLLAGSPQLEIPTTTTTAAAHSCI
jgi:hypothetical protein